MTSVDWEAARRERQERARQERSSSDAPPPPEIATIDFPSIPDEQPPPRRFVWSEWLPTGCLSSLYGAGGIGKTLLVQQLATHVVCGAPFLGARTQRAPVFGLFAEDDDDELIRRQWRINRSFGIKNSSLRDLHIQGRAGLDNVLANYPANGEPEPWPLFEATLAKARELQPGLVILDNRAQMLLGNENDRATATWSANLLAGLARETGAAVLLLGHVAKADGSSYSGSTGWDAVVRSRWWLRRLEEDDSDGQPELILERVKSN